MLLQIGNKIKLYSSMSKCKSQILPFIPAYFLFPLLHVHVFNVIFHFKAVTGWMEPSAHN